MPEGATHLGQTTFSPRPGLRSHQIDHRNPSAMELAGHSEVKIRRIRQNRQIGPFFFGRRQQLAILAIDSGNVVNYFEQPHDRQASGVNDGSDTGPLAT